MQRPEALDISADVEVEEIKETYEGESSSRNSAGGVSITITAEPQAKEQT